MLLLIIMLLILYLLQIPEEILTDAEAGDTYATEEQLTEEETYVYAEAEEDDWDGGDGGHETETEEYEYPLPFKRRGGLEQGGGLRHSDRRGNRAGGPQGRHCL